MTNKLMTILLLALVSLILNPLEAQHIKRKGKLGVQLAAAASNPQNASYQVATVFPQSTAEDMGMQKGDIILSVNGRPFSNSGEIKEVIDGFYADDPVEAVVVRDGIKKTLKGEVVAMSLAAHSETAEVFIGEVPYKDGYIRSFVNKPKGSGPFKTVYYIQGYPCQSIDVPAAHPTMRLIDALVDRGYAVFRMEKPGIGEFHNCDPCMEQSFDNEVDAFAAGYQELLKQDFVNPNQVYLFGHSLGGNVAPILGNRFQPAGIMVYGTLTKPWPDYLVDMARYTQPLVEEEVTFPETKISMLKKINRKIYEDNTPLSELSDAEKALLANWHDMKEDKYLFNRQFEFWKNFSRHNFVAYWDEIRVPVLALYGSTDVHAISSLDAEYITHIVNRNVPGSATFRLVENTDHLFARVYSKLEEMEYVESGQLGKVAFTRFNEDFPGMVHEWIDNIEKKEKVERYQLANDRFPQAFTQMSTMDVETTDLDGDGRQDLVLATEFGPNILLFNNGKTFEKDPSRELPALKEYSLPLRGEDSEDIAVADFDRDGDSDLFFVSEDTHHHELMVNDGAGHFAFAPDQIPKKGQANAVLVYDFNGDEYPDIMLGIRGKNEVYINNRGKGFSEETKQYWPENSDSTQDLLLVDIDNDGDQDIVEGIEAGGNNVYLNAGGRFTEASDRLPLMAHYETRKVIAADIDGDQDQDLFYCNVGWDVSKTSQNVLLQNDGRGYFKFVESALPAEAATTLDALFHDVDRDGKMDLLTTGLGEAANFAVYLNRSENGKIKFERSDRIFPQVTYEGGISMIAGIFFDNDKWGIYLGNHQNKDQFLLEK